MKKRGRPKKINNKDYSYTMRMSGTDVKRLEYLHDKLGVSKPDILSEALRIYYNLELNKD